MDDDKSSDDDHEVHYVNHRVNMIRGVDDNELPYTVIKINNHDISVMMDTGASLNIIDEATYYRMGADKPKFSKSRIRLFGYNSNVAIPIVGEFKTLITCKKKSIEAQFVIVKGTAKCLIGYRTLKELGVIQIINNLGGDVYNAVTVDQLKKRFPSVFTDKLGKFKRYEVNLQIDETVKPTFMRHRRVPYSMRDAMTKCINELLQADVIEPATGPTSWLLPSLAVKKRDGSMRLVVDGSHTKLAIQRTRYVIPTIEDITAEIDSACVFSKLDVRKAFHQLVLAEPSRYITTFSTHMGIFRYKRLYMGIPPAPEIFQKVLDEILDGLDGTKHISDDIITWGTSQEEHDRRLIKLLNRLEEAGLTINVEKSKISKDEIEFFGLKIGKSGVSLADDKVKCLVEAKMPSTVSQVESLIGLSQYCEKFIPNHAVIVAPLRELCRKNVKWAWEDRHTDAVNQLKKACSTKALSFFNKNLKTELHVDASPDGLGAVLMQQDIQGNHHVIAYASKSLNDVQKRYSQVEKEGLGAVWACEKFHLYVYGRYFRLIVDNKAIEYIFNNPKAKIPARIERWCLRLAQYNFFVEHRPGKGNPADYLSRNPVLGEQDAHDMAEHYINYLMSEAIPTAISQELLEIETSKDECLQAVIRRINGELKNENDLLISKEFDHVFAELSVVGHDKKALIMRSNRVVIPVILQRCVVLIAHDGHQGVSKTKELLRSKVWFVGIDRLVEEVIRSCHACQINTKSVSSEPVRMSEMPKGPWEQLDGDFYGPTADGTLLLVLIDEYSRFPIVREVASSSAIKVIPVLHEIISTFGINDKLKTDNGPPFNGAEFKRFCDTFGIKHQLITPYWPQANSEAERFMPNLTKVIRNAEATDRDWRQELQFFLATYRATPHSSTGVAPAELLFKFNGGSRLVSLSGNRFIQKMDIDKFARVKDQLAMAKMQREFDLRKKVVPSTLNVGDSVAYQVPRYKVHRKSDPLRESIIYRVIAINGSMVTVKSADKEFTRNSALFRRYYKPSTADSMLEAQKAKESTALGLRRSKRVKQPVLRYGV